MEELKSEIIPYYERFKIGYVAEIGFPIMGAPGGTKSSYLI